eukprot:CAMPEP_0176202568 /NCGR_PEP_ID=MMETSP0121_2-20121125/10137_1 /TAXON_ID=160619 /ORGANISM="Kryptoperidinium foliaceum, Strain CCMP 1326" /LENGTH=693 /DNA_ID=CAMNT_0017541457 /DNA_START=17 /DNA_END=2098 /DNA_ORIENTATION=+
MNKLQMMQQGGVSKATKTINLSEDIFAGMDFTLRGDGRRIRHREYFFLAKGRDMGFNAVLGFFSKLSSGTGEQLLSRQTFRLGQVLHLPEAMSFYYAHAGYYLTQFFVSMSMPLLVFAWLLVLLSDCEGTLDAFQHCFGEKESAASVMARMLSACFSWLVLFFLVANTAPLFAELWMEVNLKGATAKFVTSILTLSPLMFVFQAKTIGYYIVNEFRYGGASYVATGRGLPTERRPFITKNSKGVYEGLYLDYTTIAHYDGVVLLAGCILVRVASGYSEAEQPNPWVWISAGLTIAAWLYAPYVFNPYNFSRVHFLSDMRSLLAFFFAESGRHWDKWYEATAIKTRRGVRQSVNDIGFFLTVLFMATWYATLNVKATALTIVYSEHELYRLIHAAILLPPIFASLVWCLLVVLVENLFRCRTVAHQSLEVARRWAQQAAKRHQAGGTAGDSSATGGDGAADAGGAPRRSKTVVLQNGLPLALSALVVSAVNIAESVAALSFFLEAGWSRAFIAGLILKWGMSGICVFLIESILVSDKCANACSLPLRLWVRAHRMARDMIVSFIVALPQLPLVLLNWLNDYVCPGCGAHQLLIYRDPGTVERQERVFDLEEATDDGAPRAAAAPKAEVMKEETKPSQHSPSQPSLWSSARASGSPTASASSAPPATASAASSTAQSGGGFSSWFGSAPAAEAAR